MSGERVGTDIELTVEEGSGVGKVSAYRAVPATGHGRGVLVLCEVPGLEDFARDACDRLARAGFTALAPDLDGSEEAVRLADAGVRRLLDDDATDGARVAALGFGGGGVLALQVASRNRRIGGVVDFYGLPEGAVSLDGPPADTPVLLIFGEQDPRVEEGLARELEAGIRSARLDLRAQAGNGFMNPIHADRFVASAAAEGWDAAIAFLASVL